MDYMHDPYPLPSPGSIAASGSGSLGGVGAANARKRKMSPVADLLETRRLRRSHEACARCRSKKIKCDSKHPRCSACQQAGTQCHQEDRHRQTLTPRGHQEQIEAQLSVCEAMLKRVVPGFAVEYLYDYAKHQGIPQDTLSLLTEAGVPHIPAPGLHAALASQAAASAANGAPASTRPHLAPLQTAMDLSSPTHPHAPPQSARVDPESSPFAPASAQAIKLHPTLVHYNNGAGPSAPQHPDSPGTIHSISTPHSVTTPHTAAAATPSSYAGPDQPGSHAWSESPHPRRKPAPSDIKGQDPKNNDLSNPKTMVESFDLTIPAGWFDSAESSHASDREDTSISVEAMQRAPRRPDIWQEVKVHHNYTSPSIGSPSFIYLPKDRAAVRQVVNAYFKHLNFHRPVFTKRDFDEKLEHLYSGASLHDPGFMCSVYLILALGSLCELNHELFRQTKAALLTRDETRTVIDKSYRHDWIRVDEFFDRALSIKPDLRVTISSLQAMILLQWYLYIERHGRSLWRLVGNMVRLAIELGLHHDPYLQPDTFTPEECKLRVRLWCTIMIHDRGTSILFGRPLAIAPADTTTPQPKHNSNGEQDFSDHFFYSFPIMEMQADIICSLYTPRPSAPEAKMRQAIRILKRMEQFRNDELPAEYAHYFSGTERWTEQQKRSVVENVTADHGLTLLKFWIAKILLLRVLFKSRDLSFNYRSLALRDAVITAHNIIVIHCSLVRFPDAAFFVSPLPLHISAMIIIYGVMCESYVQDKQRALDDVWLALSMLPHLRWRWERKDMQGMHPIISKIAEKVFKMDFTQIKNESSPGVLVPEVPTSEYDAAEPRPQSALRQKMGKWSANSSPAPQLAIQGPASPTMVVPAGPSNTGMMNTPLVRPTPQLAAGMQHAWPEPQIGLFYPFDQENPANLQRWAPGPVASVSAQDIAAAAAMPPPASPTAYRTIGAVGCQPAQQSYVYEENDKTPPPEMNNIEDLLEMIETRGVDAVLEPNFTAMGQPHFLPHQQPPHAHMHHAPHAPHQLHPNHTAPTPQHHHQVYTSLPPRWQ
ncbi:hypothetical protein AURDEDRAFT_112760 [Auricularia subglabra TFB-10046 SS5]|nr:hypothetical protein AURDEDRAFT_112760 [Auricularia subglabra TFB-10046 SS5]